MSLSSEPELLLWLILLTWPISAKRRSLKKGDKDSDFLSAKSTTGLSRSDANEGNFHHGLFDPLGATARRARERHNGAAAHPEERRRCTFARATASRRETKTAAGGFSLHFFFFFFFERYPWLLRCVVIGFNTGSRFLLMKWLRS